KTDEEYKIDRAVGGISLTKSVLPSFAGPASGPLIVPFKYRLNDKSLTGESAIGYYAGYRIEPRIPLTNTRVPLSPFIAGGLTQINMATNGDTDNKTGVTIAVGFLVQNWAGVNIGLVGGQDRIGNGAWVHEGKNWVSFMIGWNL
ncbi:MAG: hypothetical protein OEW08_02140, partial [Gammaproteobacteria bacterium]|nr:hypothetical protein [Gammaproteobacteria bacterium]